MSATRLATSLGSLAANFFRFAPGVDINEQDIQELARKELAIDSNIAQGSGAIILHIRVRRVQETDEHWDGPSVHELLSVLIWTSRQYPCSWVACTNNLPEWVIFSKAPVAFRCTRMSFDRARRVSGTSAPDLAIFVLLSSKSRSTFTRRIWGFGTEKGTDHE